MAIDKFNTEYFTLNLNHTVSEDVTIIREQQGPNDIASLLDPFIPVTWRATGPFQSDLTARDDIILAVLSLILLLIIESIVTTVLLRTKAGQINNFAFSVKQLIELFRDLNFRMIFPRRKKGEPMSRRLNKNLIVLSFSILFVTIGLEVAALFLTNPLLKSVSNKTATFRILQPVTPEWHNVRFHARVSINRPCEPFTLEMVEQARTRINGCVETNLNATLVELFKPSKDETTLRIVSQIHDYGSDHQLTIGELSANYTLRVYFTLGDRRSRLMKSSKTATDESERMKIIHMQFVAQIFTIYRNALKEQDSDMNLNRLQALESKFFFDKNPDSAQIDVLRLPGKSLNVSTREYVTNVTGVLPQGTTVLRIAHNFFRGTAAVVVSNPDEEDLFLEEGLQESVAEVWKEKTRTVNWLSLLISVASYLTILFALRCIFKPVCTADIAGEYVRDAVGADLLRSPIEMSDDELKYFRISLGSEDQEYMLGAETLDRQSRLSKEYGQFVA